MRLQLGAPWHGVSSEAEPAIACCPLSAFSGLGTTSKCAAFLFAPGAERGVGGRGDRAVLGWGGTIPISLLYVSESAALAIVQILISKEGRIIFTIGIFCLSS